MSDHLPPLTALRAFDAAARHLSFAKAAAELHVTPAALSFQIKSLEDHLGAQVFRRLNRAVELTEVGRLLAPRCTEGFEALSAAWRSARRHLDMRVLTVTAGPAFTTKWLAPRLYEFAQAHPEIELRFSASLRQMDFDRDEVDVAIRYGYGPDTGLFSIPLIRDWMAPMMTPELARRYPEPRDLRRAPLFYDDSTHFLDPPIDWAVWLRAAGVDHTPVAAARFSQADHAIDAALAGGGVVLTRNSLAAQALARGQLVAPYPMAVGTDARFRFICPPGAENRPQIAAFLSWLQTEIREVMERVPEKEIRPAADFAS